MPKLPTGAENPEEKLPLVSGLFRTYPSGSGRKGADRPPEKEGKNAAWLSQVFASGRRFSDKSIISTGAENPAQEERPMPGQMAAGDSSMLGLHVMRGKDLVVAMVAPPFPDDLGLWKTLRRLPEFEGCLAILCRRSAGVEYLPAPQCLVGGAR